MPSLKKGRQSEVSAIQRWFGQNDSCSKRFGIAESKSSICFGLSLPYGGSSLALSELMKVSHPQDTGCVRTHGLTSAKRCVPAAAM